MHFWHNNHHLVIIVAEIKKLQIQHFDYWTFKSLICVCKLKLYAVFSVTRSFLGTRAYMHNENDFPKSHKHF